MKNYCCEIVIKVCYGIVIKEIKNFKFDNSILKGIRKDIDFFFLFLIMYCYIFCDMYININYIDIIYFYKLNKK